MTDEMYCEPDDNAIDLVEIEFRDGTLYFKAEDDDHLESDDFRKLGGPKNAILRNLNNQVLMKKSGMDIAVLEDMTDCEIQANAPQTVFIMQAYKETVPKGLAIAILVRSKNQIYSLSCQNKELQFKEGAAPNHIASTTSDFIFYQKKVIGHEKMQFESSLYPGYFLACEKEQQGYFKLVLKEGCEEVDKFMMFIVQYC
ncbi:interleukin-18 isoform X1 [Phascolarctos cinereus]|uniref:Interleukin-18 n=1 Tax=Phascolarctos cinereus TaxID=38626 RepID=A0A6P5KLB6_PHACI|nr:interleukin-18 [Phascolarctos cinereus]XP_020845417.1 interleukin-18 [Phascolarctos cinereus]XP_020845418.1 interleukin-18 [Phascolarctos cinereus]